MFWDIRSNTSQVKHPNAAGRARRRFRGYGWFVVLVFCVFTGNAWAQNRVTVAIPIDFPQFVLHGYDRILITGYREGTADGGGTLHEYGATPLVLEQGHTTIVRDLITDAAEPVSGSDSLGHVTLYFRATGGSGLITRNDHFFVTVAVRIRRGTLVPDAGDSAQIVATTRSTRTRAVATVTHTDDWGSAERPLRTPPITLA